MRLCGGAAGEMLWQFPLAGLPGQSRTRKRFSMRGRSGTTKKPAVAMLRQLVLAIRIWRPDVIVTDSPTDELAKTVNLVLRKAFEVAADPEAFPEQIKDLGLEAWAGRKLLVALDKVDPTAVKADVTSPLPRLGDSAREYASTAFRLWDDRSGRARLPSRRDAAEGQRRSDAHSSTASISRPAAPRGASKRH